MAEYAPQALRWLGNAIVKAIPSARFSGIVGDPSHKYGYHRARNRLPKNDYSVQTGPDKAGDGWAASALDISFDSKWMKTITKRLLASAKDQNDPRLNCMREFFGTTNGSSVAGWDTYYGRPATSDDSHLWHVHMSILRKYANDRKALAGVLSVIKGEKELDVDLDDKVKLSEWIPQAWPDLDETITVRTALGSAYGHARQAKDLIRDAVPEILAGQAAILEALRGSSAAEIQNSVREELGRVAPRQRGADGALAERLGPALVTALTARLGDAVSEADLTAAVTEAIGAVLPPTDHAESATESTPSEG